MKTPDSTIDQLVLVVHGVGDPAPGETLDLFARSLAEDHHPLSEAPRALWLPEKSSDPQYVKTFPSPVRHLENEQATIELAEVFWGDLSRVWRGLPGTLWGIVQIIFGLRYIAYVAADQPGPFAFWLKRFGLMSAKILHGPILAVTFFLTLLALTVATTQLMWPESYRSVFWTRIVLIGCCGFALTVSSLGWQLTRNRVIERLWFWVNVTAIFIGGVMFLKMVWLNGTVENMTAIDHVTPGLMWYCRVLVVLLGFLSFAEIMLLTAMGVCWAGAIVHPKAHRPALHIAILLPALSVGIWGQLLPMSWLAIKELAKKFLNLGQFDALFQEVVPLLGVQVMMLGALILTGALLGLRFIRWRTTHDVCHFCEGARAPRLIVHGMLQLVLGICTFVGVVLVMAIGFCEIRNLHYTDFGFGRTILDIDKYVITVLVPVSFLMVFLLPRLQPIFDIVLDVTNHFYFRPTHIRDALFDEDEFDIRETTFERGTLFFARRDAIHVRMKRILAYYQDTLDHRPELVIVAHSQGTMIAIEVLNDPELAWLQNRFSSVTLVTMGSPFTNLFQYYFSHLYPALDQPFWSPLRKGVDRWINIFRIDDPVGTEIDFPPAWPEQTCENRGNHDRSHSHPSGQNETSYDDRGTIQGPIQGGHSDSTPPNASILDSLRVRQGASGILYSNHAVGCRGHVNYFNDREVVDILRSEVFVNCNGHNHRRAA